MGLKDLFNNDYETSEANPALELQTHYYRNRSEEVIRVVKEMIASEGGQIKAEIPQFQEIFYETSGYSCTVIIVGVRPTETAVDFKITTYKLIANGRGKKIIKDLYQYLDNNLSFKGLGLYNK